MSEAPVKPGDYALAVAQDLLRGIESGRRAEAGLRRLTDALGELEKRPKYKRLGVDLREVLDGGA